MTAQRTPHTPLWRQILSLPHTSLGWWAIGLAAPALALIVFTNVLEILGWTFPSESVGAAIGLTAFLVGLPGGVFGLIAVGRDRSWLVWVAQVPAMLVFAFFVWARSSMSIGHNANVWVTFPIAVFLWAVANFFMILVRIAARGTGPRTKL